MEVIQIRCVIGASKSKSVLSPYSDWLTLPVMKYDASAVRIIRTRMANIQIISCPQRTGAKTMASARNAISATPVTPYVSKPSAVGPTLSPALSPVQSAITPGFLGSSSGSFIKIFIRSEPRSAILVKIPPQILNAIAPRDSPIANPTKDGPASSLGIKHRMQIIKKSSTLTRRSPTLIPDLKGMAITFRGLPRSDSNAVLELATVLILIPNQATP